MNPEKARMRAALIVLLVSLLQGCYYMQAARGQLGIMRARQPIDELVTDDATPVALGSRLELVQIAREFSVAELGLPDNDSYRSYADLERDYVLWNVIAAPEFSLQPKRWCYPVVGCVSYRGYFKQESARKKGDRLIEDGYDVLVGGVAAYSTLGKFDDPILNTMMHWDDEQLIAVMFHELAHQKLYVKDDTAFNESFATAVEQIGIERFLASRGEAAALQRYYDRRDHRSAVFEAVTVAREDLRALYAAEMDVPDRRSQKAERLRQLEAEIRDAFMRSGQQAPAWLNGGMNNARIVSMLLYNSHVAGFRRLLEDCDGKLDCFYRETRALAKRSKADRGRRLRELTDSVS